MKRFLFLSVFFIILYPVTNAHNNVKRISDVVYDHREGVAFVFDVLVPKKQNGIAIFYMVSGGWSSSNAAKYKNDAFKEFTDRGETVFLVSHGSKPRYKVPEIISQIQHAIQYARYHAKDFGVDPNRFGIMGRSSGGHLSVSAAVFGKDAVSEAEYRQTYSVKETDIVDPVNLVSSKVQAVACYYPPLNLVSYHHPDSTFADYQNVTRFVGAFDIAKDATREEVKRVFMRSSPYFFVTKATPPILIFQGTKDPLVPYSQAVDFMNKLKDNNVPCQLITKEGAAHGWAKNETDIQAMINWFEKYLPASK
jgi:acetyl esterase/lipase